MSFHIGYASPPDADASSSEFALVDNVLNCDKIGGKAVWPSTASLSTCLGLTCPSCQDPLLLVCQLVASIHHQQQHQHQKHRNSSSKKDSRWLYLFACARGACSNSPGSWRTIRVVKRLKQRQPIATTCNTKSSTNASHTGLFKFNPPSSMFDSTPVFGSSSLSLMPAFGQDDDVFVGEQSPSSLQFQFGGNGGGGGQQQQQDDWQPVVGFDSLGNDFSSMAHLNALLEKRDSHYNNHSQWNDNYHKDIDNYEEEEVKEKDEAVDVLEAGESTQVLVNEAASIITTTKTNPTVLSSSSSLPRKTSLETITVRSYPQFPLTYLEFGEEVQEEEEEYYGNSGGCISESFLTSSDDDEASGGEEEVEEGSDDENVSLRFTSKPNKGNNNKNYRKKMLKKQGKYTHEMKLLEEYQRIHGDDQILLDAMKRCVVSSKTTTNNKKSSSSSSSSSKEKTQLNTSDLIDNCNNGGSGWTEEKYEDNTPSFLNNYFYQFSQLVQSDPDACLRWGWGYGYPVWYSNPRNSVTHHHHSYFSSTITTSSSRTSSSSSSNLSVPACQYCGAKRVFEMQLLPRLLDYLPSNTTTHSSSSSTTTKPQDALKHLLEASSARLDFGTVVVYTCGNDCTGNDSPLLDDDDDKYMVRFMDEVSIIQFDSLEGCWSGDGSRYTSREEEN